MSPTTIIQEVFREYGNGARVMRPLVHGSLALAAAGMLDSCSGSVPENLATAAPAALVVNRAFVNVQTGKCLTIAGGRSTENNVPGLQFNCDNDLSRRWALTNPDHDTYQLKNAQTRKCLTIAGGVLPDNNLPTVQFDCDNDPSRRWRLTNASGDSVEFRNVQTGKCLTIAGGRSTENNVPALQFDCDGDPSRRWHLRG